MQDSDEHVFSWDAPTFGIGRGIFKVMLYFVVMLFSMVVSYGKLSAMYVLPLNDAPSGRMLSGHCVRTRSQSLFSC
jgi:hypothetical protein